MATKYKKNSDREMPDLPRRNLVVLRKGGSHGKSKKAQRAKDKRALSKDPDNQ